MDLAASWRVLTKQKLNIINGIRLENASWRTWAKQRNNLKTVSPETLNWLKDSDVTWLYGPLHTVMKQDKKHIRPLPSPLQKPQEKPLKSALKKVTMSDLLKRSASELQIHQNNPKKKDDDLSASSSLSISKVNQEVGAFSPSVIANHRQPKLRFNQYVEQCIALTGKSKNTASDDTDSYEPDDDDDDDNDDNNKDEEEEEEEVIMMKPKLQQKIRSIKKIEPTLLKTSSRSDESSTSSDDEIGDTSYYNYRLRRYNSSHAKQRKNSYDWEAESADSDALVQHIIRVSKDRNAINHAGSSNSNSNNNNNNNNNNSSSSSRSNNNNNNNSMIHWNTDDIDQDYIPSKSDYDYEFDDDDWDTHSEHIDDAPSFTAQKKRSNSISSSHTHSTNSSTSSSSSSSILNNIVRWASNHLWSSSDNEDK
ncbi:unnamed protein product [Rhizopus microsporus]